MNSLFKVRFRVRNFEHVLYENDRRFFGTFLWLVETYTGGGGGGGVRYQVPDFTLVGGSFFLPKTQLVHGTNWWVYCPFSRKTVSTWY